MFFCRYVTYVHHSFSHSPGDFPTMKPKFQRIPVKPPITFHHSIVFPFCPLFPSSRTPLFSLSSSLSFHRVLDLLSSLIFFVSFMSFISLFFLCFLSFSFLVIYVLCFLYVLYVLYFRSLCSLFLLHFMYLVNMC